MKKTGKILLSSELGREYGFKDVGGIFHKFNIQKLLCITLTVKIFRYPTSFHASSKISGSSLLPELRMDGSRISLFPLVDDCHRNSQVLVT